MGPVFGSAISLGSQLISWFGLLNLHGIPNFPTDPDLAVAAGRGLCEHLLEPLQAAFGRLAIRSAYRSPGVNAFGNIHHHNCASNERNYGRHIWDRRDSLAYLSEDRRSVTHQLFGRDERP